MVATLHFKTTQSQNSRFEEPDGLKGNGNSATYVTKTAIGTCPGDFSGPWLWGGGSKVSLFRQAAANYSRAWMQ